MDRTQQPPVAFDLFYTAESPYGDHVRDYGEILEQVQHAEHLGFSGIWLAEHHGSNYGIAPSPAVLLTAIAQRTSRIKLGSGVSVLPFTHPVRIAEEYAMLDVLSGGRLQFGTGRGYQPREFATFGRDQSQARSLYDESIAVIRGLWENETFSFAGEHFAFEDVRLFPRPLQERVPMWVAAASPESFTLAAANGLQIMTQPSLRQTLDQLRDNLDAARRIYAEHGWSEDELDMPINVVVHLEEDAERAREVAEEHVVWHLDRHRSLAPGAGGTRIARGYEAYRALGTLDQQQQELSVERLNAAHVSVIGDPQMARDYVTTMRDKIGMRHMLCSMRFGGLDHEAVIRSLDLFASEVMPAFAAPAQQEDTVGGPA